MSIKITADFENIDQATIAINAVRSRKSCKGVSGIRLCTNSRGGEEEDGFFSNLFLSSAIQNGIVQNGIIQNDIVQNGVVTYPLNYGASLEYEQRTNDYDQRSARVEVFTDSNVKSVISCLRSNGGLNVKEIEKG